MSDDSQDGAAADPDADGNPGNNGDPTPVMFPSLDYDLAASKTGPGEVNNGDPANWTIVVTNSGPAPAPAPIVVTDVLPAGLDFVAAAGNGWSCSAAGRTVTCTRATDLAIGASSSLTIQTRAFGAEGERLSNTVSVESQGLVAEPVLSNNEASASLIFGVLPATGRNLGTLAWSGLIMLLLGAGLLGFLRRRRADRLWIEYGIRA